MKRLIALFCCLLITSCVSTVRPYKSPSNLSPESEGENRLWGAAEKFDEAIDNSDSIYHDPELESYLLGVINQLFPEYSQHMRIRVLKAPVLNAMALPNGSIYVNSGLLVVMENEAQLATVLAHEGTHFLQKHSALEREHTIQAAGWTMAASIALAAAGVPGDLATLGLMSSITGYSRELEQEADNLGYARLQSAGYDVRESPEVFRHMIREVEAEDIKRPFLFSTHPKLQDRIDNFEAYNKKVSEGYKGRVQGEEFLLASEGIRYEALGKKLEAGNYRALIAILENEKLAENYGAYGQYILGEAYRLRNQDNDLELAMDAFDNAWRQGYDAAELFRGKGLIAYKLGHFSEALSNFIKYLTTASSDDPERGFIEMYIKNIKDRGHE